MKNIVVNFESKTIELTKNFSKRAGVFGSPEYRSLVEVKREFPDYTLFIKPSHSYYSPSPYSRLTYADMEAIIMRCEDVNKREEWLDEFNTFSIYQILPQLIDLWGLNVQTDAEAKKKFDQLKG